LPFLEFYFVLQHSKCVLPLYVFDFSLLFSQFKLTSSFYNSSIFIFLQDEKEREIRERIKEIPNMLKKADIRSRVTSNLNAPKAEDSGFAK